MRKIFLSIGLTSALLVAILGLMLWLGKPVAPPPMQSIRTPFKSVDHSGMPPLQTFPARDKTPLAYRHYEAARGKAPGTVVLVHGSSAMSSHMHPLARALSAAGWEVFALDMRGHGKSGEKGKLAYVGQLEDDLEDFMAAVPGRSPRFLVGLSSGGGFALRVAGGGRQGLFDGYLLLSPYLNPSASTTKVDGGGWVGVGVPRIVALSILNRWGLRAFNGLPVLAFALTKEDGKVMTAEYSYNLWFSFQPHDDYRSDIRGAGRPMAVLAGAEDEVFRADRFAGEFGINPRVKVTLVPGLNHVGLVLDPRGLKAILEAVDALRGTKE